LEFHADKGDSFLATLPVAADVLAIAGDLAPIRFLDQARKWFKALCRNRRRVLFVSGNHEYYGSSPRHTDSILLQLEKELPELCVLRPGRVEEIDGHRILGSTLWFRDDPMNPIFGIDFNDFTEIKRAVPWIYEQNRAAMRFFTNEAQKGDIILTHHVPSAKSIDPHYAESNQNRFFLCDMEDLIRVVQPALWMHGHTHSHFQYLIGTTQIVCNPLGYPFEGRTLKGFNDSLVLEVP
jgi:Icc-related predicted phosphoesterase